MIAWLTLCDEKFHGFWWVIPSDITSHLFRAFSIYHQVRQIISLSAVIITNYHNLTHWPYKCQVWAMPRHSFEKISEALAIFWFKMSCTSKCISFNSLASGMFCFQTAQKASPWEFLLIYQKVCSRTYFSIKEILSNFISSLFFITLAKSSVSSALSSL